MACGGHVSKKRGADKHELEPRPKRRPDYQDQHRRQQSDTHQHQCQHLHHQQEGKCYQRMAYQDDQRSQYYQRSQHYQRSQYYQNDYQQQGKYYWQGGQYSQQDGYYQQCETYQQQGQHDQHGQLDQQEQVQDDQQEQGQYCQHGQDYQQEDLPAGDGKAEGVQFDDIYPMPIEIDPQIVDDGILVRDYQVNTLWLKTFVNQVLSACLPNRIIAEMPNLKSPTVVFKVNPEWKILADLS